MQKLFKAHNKFRVLCLIVEKSTAAFVQNMKYTSQKYTDMVIGKKKKTQKTRSLLDKLQHSITTLIEPTLDTETPRTEIR